MQVKCPCVTVARAAAAIAAGKTPLTNDPNKSMAFARAAGAFGVALGLGEIGGDDFNDASLLSDFSIQSPRASISSGVEVECNEVVVLGNSESWGGDLRIAHRPMADALDIDGVASVFADLGIAASPQVSAADAARLAAAGYRLALVGSALMQAGDPAMLARELLKAGRAACGTS